jgi:hypothetical protein
LVEGEKKQWAVFVKREQEKQTYQKARAEVLEVLIRRILLVLPSSLVSPFQRVLEDGP